MSSRIQLPSKSGLTTSIALQLLGRAVSSGGQWVAAKDHKSGQDGMNELFQAVDMYVTKTDLKVEVKVNLASETVEVRAVYRF